MSEHEQNQNNSAPVLGPEGTHFESNDVHPGIVIWSLLIVAALTALGFAIIVPIQKYFEHTHPVGEFASPLAPDRVVPPAPQVQVQPWEDLPEMRAAEDKLLHESGRDKFGRVHIPIENAIDDVLPLLKIDPNAPVGLTTPGGQGREYSHTPVVRSAPAQIQGEVRKNVEQ